ncbi:3542_t:CDS:2 [Paraglomus occultum]|uniref:3542_t:CDS:1 n=1 Tax=Paraglomus occultum TaxID=144539 RepID=A0A9N9FW62_9GLOM|nr:3542_t:CDS:2 [Paraglomus occultum]
MYYKHRAYYLDELLFLDTNIPHEKIFFIARASTIILKVKAPEDDQYKLLNDATRTTEQTWLIQTILHYWLNGTRSANEIHQKTNISLRTVERKRVVAAIGQHIRNNDTISISTRQLAVKVQEIKEHHGQKHICKTTGAAPSSLMRLNLTFSEAKSVDGSKTLSAATRQKKLVGQIQLYTSNVAKNFIAENRIKAIDWPAKVPTLILWKPFEGERANDGGFSINAIFLSSMLLNIAFPSTSIWMTRVLGSLCTKPKLISTLYAILWTAHVIPHSMHHEKTLERQRIRDTKPEDRVIKKETIWNICVVDNIDFVEKTFAYGNIFDAARRSIHATVRMKDKSVRRDRLRKRIITYIIEEVFRKDSNTWCQETVLDAIRQTVIDGCNVPPPNVVILKPGESPNCNANVHKACKMYFDDVGTENSGCLDIVCDEALFRRLIPFEEQHSQCRLMLGQWHTSKNSAELNPEGYKRLFECYDIGVARMNAILRQDVYKTEPRVVKGRRGKNVTVHKWDPEKGKSLIRRSSKKQKQSKTDDDVEMTG